MEDSPPVVVKLSANIKEDCIQWLIKRIQTAKIDNGCQLIVKREKENNVLYISASKKRLLHGAEIIGLRKQYKDGSMREFCYEDKENFEHFEDDDFLLESEIHYIIKIELDGLRAIDETHIPGYPSIKLYPGKSLFRRLTSYSLVDTFFPLHNRRTLQRLRVEWYKNLKSIKLPLRSVRDYFGNTISIYFAFLHYYTIALVPLAFVGILHWLFGDYQTSWGKVSENWLLSLVHVVWSAALMEMWKRKSNEYSYKWGSLGMKEWEEPRTGFRGPLGKNEITQRQEPVYPSWKRNLRIYGVSWPIAVLCMGMAVWFMFYYFSWEFYLIERYANNQRLSISLLKNLPSVIYSIFVLVANGLYRKLAEYLTDQENHRLESNFQNHLIAKILVFDFANSFLCLFYIAFVYNDIPMLRMTLRNLFLVHMIISQALETLLPYWQYKMRSASIRKKNSLPNAVYDQDKTELNIVEQTRLELQREDYMGTFDDYLELWLQFGYVVLFSCVYPPAALFALLNNIVEARSDAFKMCNAFRRPFTFQSSGIGAWEVAFQALSYLAIVSNLALIFHSPAFLKWFYNTVPFASPANVLVCFIALEHFLLLARWLTSLLVPAIPHWVNVETGKLKYWSMQALKKQRSAHLQQSTSIDRETEDVDYFTSCTDLKK